MPWIEQYKQQRDHEHLRKAADSRLIWVHRPILVHDRAPSTKDICPCCNSRLAHVVEALPHLDVLINPRTGERAKRSDQPSPKEFDDLCTRALKLDMPRRVSFAQLAALECQAKVLAAFGGVRGGKSSFLADEIVDGLLHYGGHGVQIWWAAPTLEKTEIALRKLVLGETVGKGDTKRYVAPLLPPEIVSHVPSSARSDRKYIELIDGTRIYLKFLGKDGGNLKGDPPVLVGMDEGCAVRDRENYRQMLDRLMEADGRLIIATTPVAGHWFKEDVYDAGVHVSQWDGEQHAWAHLTAFDNPWVSKDAINSAIKAINDPQRVQREIYGKWVGDGPRLWRHFEEAKHVVKHDGYRPEEWGIGLRNITAAALDRFFRGKHDEYGGMDFDINPMSFTAHQICCHEDHDPQDPSNWIFVQFDERIDSKAGTVHAFADNLQDDGFSNWGIACDPSGAQHSSYRMSHGVDFNSTHAAELERMGFEVEPCHRSEKGRPRQPPVLDRCNVMHKLMNERVRPGLPRMLIHERCAKTIDSYRVQEADSHGMPVKETDTKSDRQSGPTDAATYAAWAGFQGEYNKAAEWLN